MKDRTLIFISILLILDFATALGGGDALLPLVRILHFFPHLFAFGYLVHATSVRVKRCLAVKHVFGTLTVSVALVSIAGLVCFWLARDSTDKLVIQAALRYLHAEDMSLHRSCVINKPPNQAVTIIQRWGLIQQYEMRAHCADQSVLLMAKRRPAGWKVYRVVEQK